MNRRKMMISCLAAFVPASVLARSKQPEPRIINRTVTFSPTYMRGYEIVRDRTTTITFDRPLRQTKQGGFATTTEYSVACSSPDVDWATVRDFKIAIAADGLSQTHVIIEAVGLDSDLIIDCVPGAAGHPSQLLRARRSADVYGGNRICLRAVTPRQDWSVSDDPRNPVIQHDINAILIAAEGMFAPEIAALNGADVRIDLRLPLDVAVAAFKTWEMRDYIAGAPDALAAIQWHNNPNRQYEMPPYLYGLRLVLVGGESDAANH